MDASEDGPDLSPDELVSDVLGSDGPQDLITLVGFVGECSVPGYHRLYVDPALTCWVDVPDGDIAHRRRLPAESDAFGGRSVLWVNRDAVLIKGALTSAQSEADFLAGDCGAEIASNPCDETLQAAKMAPVAAAFSIHLTPPGPTCC
jgi:hypothetical protein